VTVRIPLIAGNWKMNQGGAAGVALAAEVARRALAFRDVEVLVAPPFTALAAVAHEVDAVARAAGRTPIGVAAQNLWYEPQGAFTGEVSASMLVESGARWVIVGHSERRSIFRETDEQVAAKARAALAHGLRPIVCVGEHLEDREAGRTLDVVLAQIEAVATLLIEASSQAVVAYEPVWAIGTGRVATPEDAQAVHAAIRGHLGKRDATAAARLRILYGGSVNAKNAQGLLDQPDIDGALVGGASLDVEGFATIMAAGEAVAFRRRSA
jgi:triosephosphate isomerase